MSTLRAKTVIAALVAALVLGALTLTPVAHAAPGGRPGPGAGAKREKIRERIQQLRNDELKKQLGLADTTAGTLFAVVNKYDDLIFPLKAEIGQARRELKQMLDAGKVDDARANKLIDTMVADRAKIEQYERARFDEARKILTPAQSAKLVVYLPDIERAIEREIRKAVRKRLGDGGAGGGDDGE
jgi:Spy/CpxP family protein refolding chaperone